MNTSSRPKTGKSSPIRRALSRSARLAPLASRAADPLSPQFPRVLVPMDLSPKSRGGLRYVLKLPKALIGRIWLLYVQPPDSFLNGLDTIPLVISNEVARQNEGRALEKILRQEAPISHRGGTLVRIGTPDHEIVAAAQELDINLIVMTTHGYQGLSHVLHPSVSEHVVRNAPCPVLTLNRAQLSRRQNPRHR